MVLAVLALTLRLAAFLGLCDYISLRGVALAGGVFVVVVQTAGVEVGFDILGEWFLVKAYHSLDKYRLTVLKLGAFGGCKSPAPQLGGYLELLTLLEAVHSFA